jgi:hypothetical protein
LKQKIDTEWSDKFSDHLKRLLILYAELLKFDVVDSNKFMSVFKNMLDITNELTVEMFVRCCYSTLKERPDTS